MKGQNKCHTPLLGSFARWETYCPRSPLSVQGHTCTGEHIYIAHARLLNIRGVVLYIGVVVVNLMTVSAVAQGPCLHRGPACTGGPFENSGRRSGRLESLTLCCFIDESGYG